MTETIEIKALQTTTKEVHKLIQNGQYAEAITLMHTGRASPVSAMNVNNLELCLSHISHLQRADKRAPLLPYKFYMVGLQNKFGVLRQKINDSAAATVITDTIVESMEPSSLIDHTVLCVDDAPSALTLYKVIGDLLDHSTIVLQIYSVENYKERVHTIEWLRRLGINCFLIPDFESGTLVYPSGKYLLEPGVIEVLSKQPVKIADKNGMSVSELYSDALAKLRDLDIPFLEHDEIVKVVRKNLGRDKLRTDESIVTYCEEGPFYPNENDELYLRNKYYNITGQRKPASESALRFFSGRQCHKNYYSELIHREVRSFQSDPTSYLGGSQTVIFLDPTCHDQSSGISSYLTNMYKFFKMSRLCEQTLYIKNPWPQSEKSNRALFRELVAELFNPLVSLSKNVIFFDSEAHYPGQKLSKTFRRICITHCSSILAAQLNGRLPSPIPESLRDITRLELESIKTSFKCISPTRHHDEVQKTFYSDVLGSGVTYDSDVLVNYIHDEYLPYKPFRHRKYDLVFLGRAQKMKGFDIFLDLAQAAPDLSFAVITDDLREFDGRVKSLSNVASYTNSTKDTILTVVSDSCALIDLSPHHSCSTVLQEAIVAKTPAVLRDIPTYNESIDDNGLRDLYYLVDQQELDDNQRLVASLVNYISKLRSNADPEYTDKLFNNYLCRRYTSNYRYYSHLLRNVGFNRKVYRKSKAYEKYLEGKSVICVVHSNSLKPSDGSFIDHHDVVVRFNRSLENVIREKQGSRTDVLYSCINRSPDSGNMSKETYKRWIEPASCWVVKAFPNLSWNGWFSFQEDHQAGATIDNHKFECYNKDPVRTSELSTSWYKIIETNIHSRPNTGVLAILDIIQYDPKFVYLKGFTFFKGGYDSAYRQQNEQEVLAYMQSTGYHNQYKQNLFLKKILLTEPSIQMDETLQNVLSEM